MARDALSKISAHEDVCAVRWESAMATMREVKDTLKSRANFETWAMRSGILAMIGIIGWLANKAFS